MTQFINHRALFPAVKVGSVTGIENRDILNYTLDDGWLTDKKLRDIRNYVWTFVQGLVDVI